MPMLANMPVLGTWINLRLFVGIHRFLKCDHFFAVVSSKPLREYGSMVSIKKWPSDIGETINMTKICIRYVS